MRTMTANAVPISVAIAFAHVGAANAVDRGVADENERVTAVSLGAQSASSAGEEESRVSSRRKSMEEVIVTAQKREERLQDVPFSISAISTDELERTGVAGAEDYLAQVPGVYLTSMGRGRSPIIIRGVSTAGSTGDNLQRPAEMYLDELPLLDRFAPWTQPDPGTFDIERVEVLRGPQGTLFGSGAMSGAVRLISAQPDLSRFVGKVELEHASTDGGDDSNSVSGMVNIPLADEVLGLRIVGYRRREGGWTDNVTRGERDVNGGLIEGGRAILAYRPSEAFQARLTAFYDHQVLDDSNQVFADSALGDRNSWNGVIPERNDSKISIYNLNLDSDIGPVTLTSATTYGVRDVYLDTDWGRGFGLTAEDIDVYEFWLTPDSTRFSQEFRVVSNGEGRLKYTLGAFYLDFNQDLRQVWDVLPGDAVLLDETFTTESKEKAIFGEATYRISDRVSLTAGARWFKNNYSSGIESEPNASIQDHIGPLKSTDSAITPKFSISFYSSEYSHLYALASKGYRIGQTNLNPLGTTGFVPTEFGPDSLWNYEVGMKTSLLEQRLFASVAVYYIDWSDMQVRRTIDLPPESPVPSTGITQNAGKARIRGVETEVRVSIANSLEVGISFAYNDAELRSVLSGVPLAVGSVLPGSPEFTTSNYVQLSHDFSGAKSTYARLNHRYVGQVYSDIANSDAVRSESFNVLDARAGLIFGNYELVVSVENLTNEDAFVFRDERIFAPGLSPWGSTLRPRTVGLTVRASF